MDASQTFGSSANTTIESKVVVDSWRAWRTLLRLWQRGTSKGVSLHSNVLTRNRWGASSMAYRSALVILLFTLSGCSSLCPYYPIFPTVKLQKSSDVSDIEIVPTSPNGSGASSAPNNAGTYHGSWKATGNSSYAAQWNYTETKTQNSPLPPVDNRGTLGCDDNGHDRSGEIVATRECEVKKAIDYANAANDEYIKAQWQHSSMPGLAGLALLPAAASATALGMLGVGATAVTGLGVGAATMLGLGLYLHTPDREAVYNTGSLGIQCMLENMEPYTRINSLDLSILTRTIDSGTILGADDGIDVGNLDLTRAKDRLDLQINNVEALGLQNNCQRLPRVMKIASLLLIAAKAADKAADKTIQAGNEFARTALAAPISIVNKTNDINTTLNKELIAKEAKLSDLAGSVKSAASDPREQALAGLTADAQNAAADAQTKTANATSAKPATKQTPSPSPGTENMEAPSTFAPNTVFKELGQDQVQIIPSHNLAQQTGQAPGAQSETFTGLKAPGLTPRELVSLLELERSIYVVNELNSRVLRIIGSYTGKVDNSKCPILSKQAGVAPSMKLIPSDDIVLAAGSKTTIAISGATNPYTRPLFPQSVCSAVTSTLKSGEIDLAATAMTTPGFYPFFAGDGATGRIFNVMVTPKAQTDNTDKVQECTNPHDPGYVPKKPKPKNQKQLTCPPFVPMTQPTADTSELGSDSDSGD